MTDAGQDPHSRQVAAAIAEYLKLAERGTPPDLAAFLAQHSNVAAELGEFLSNNRALKQAQPRFAVDAPTIDLVVSTDVAPANASFGTIARTGLSAQLEIRTLLRQRLRIFASFFSIGAAASMVAVWILVNTAGPRLMTAGVVVGLVGLTTWLWSPWPISLRVLRWIEAGVFGVTILYFGWREFAFLRSEWFATLASYHLVGIITAAQAQNATWVMILILYGLLIPNTVRRCLIAVGLIVSIRIMLLSAVVSTLSGVTVRDMAMFIVIAVLSMAFGSGLAVFGAHRIETLRRTAAEARKLGPYQLIRRLGAGGMGEVYLAQHALLRRPCALKLIRPDQVGDRSTLARFEREVQTMAALTHPNTVRVYDYGLSADGTFYYAMEYLPGLSLHELVTTHGPLPPARAIYLLRQVCDALREAHAVGLVHRDIKPANILACQIGGVYDVAKLLDFGLVYDHSTTANAANLTRQGTIAGTPAFMSPEQAGGSAGVDARSDIYSLGAVAYFLLTGRPPFVRSTSVETMAAHLAEPIVAPRLLCPDIPGDFEEVVVRCLLKRREQRFADVTAFEQALAQCECRDGWTCAQASDWWQNSTLTETGVV